MFVLDFLNFTNKIILLSTSSAVFTPCIKNFLQFFDPQLAKIHRVHINHFLCKCASRAYLREVDNIHSSSIIVRNLHAVNHVVHYQRIPYFQNISTALHITWLWDSNNCTCTWSVSTIILCIPSSLRSLPPMTIANTALHFVGHAYQHYPPCVSAHAHNLTGTICKGGMACMEFKLSHIDAAARGYVLYRALVDFQLFDRRTVAVSNSCISFHFHAVAKQVQINR